MRPKMTWRHASAGLPTIGISTPQLCSYSDVSLCLPQADLSHRTPETFDIVSSTIDVPSRKNLAQISRVLTQISSGSEFGEDQPCYVPINDYVRNAIKQLGAWFMEGSSL